MQLALCRSPARNGARSLSVCLSAISLLALLPQVYAGDTTQLSGLDEYIEGVRADWHNVGVSVAVVRGDEVIFQQGFGSKRKGGSAAVNPTTRFQIGSLTKSFTAAALGILVDDGKVRWDGPLYRYWSQFEVQDAWLTRQVTIRDALAHRSGVMGKFYYALGVMNADEALKALRFPLMQAPYRDSFVYSNLIYSAAGRVIEATAGTSWQSFVTDRLLRPLDMRNTVMSPYQVRKSGNVAPTFLGQAPDGAGSGDAEGEDIAMPHGFGEGGRVVVLPWQSYDNAAAAGAMVSSAEDLAHWLILQMNGGRYEGRRILQEETVAELHSIQNRRLPLAFPFDDPSISARDDTGYAMGWRRAAYRGDVHLSHSGGIIGFPAYIAFLQDAKVGVVVLSNGPMAAWDDYSFNKAIAFSVLDRLTGAPTRNWQEELRARSIATGEAVDQREAELRNARVEGLPPALPLADYAGRYADREGGFGGTVQISVRDDKLSLSFEGEGAYAASLQPWHGEVFRMHSSNVPVDRVIGQYTSDFVTFVLDPYGRAALLMAFGATFHRM